MDLQTGVFSELLAEQRERLPAEQRERLRAERRSSLENPQTPLSFPAEWLLDIFNGGRTDSGVRVSELTAFEAAVFHACVDLISGTIASLPAHVYERVALQNGRLAHKVAYDHGLYDLVALEPNPEMTSLTLYRTMLVHMLAWRNCYVELQRDASNRVVGMWPRNPYRTRPYRLMQDTRLKGEPWRPFPVNLTAGALCYKTTDAIDKYDPTDSEVLVSSTERFIPADDMIHVPGLTFDGRVGESVVWLARQTLGLSLATEKFGAKYFANYARPGGLLTAPAGITAEQREQSRRSWEQAQGGENSHKTAMLPGGWDFKPLSNKPDESQLVETQTQLMKKICALFHVSPHMMAERGEGRSPAEQEAQEFVSYCLVPLKESVCREMKRKLFPSPGVGRVPKSRFYVDFDMTDILRPDAASRNAFYAAGRQWGFLNTNDIRAFEKLNPIAEDWAEWYWQPVNMTLVTTPIDPTHQDGSGKGTQPAKTELPAEDAPTQASDARMAALYWRLFRDSVGRISTRKVRDSKALAAAFEPVLLQIRDAAFARACQELALDGEPGDESARFVSEYLGAMEKRAAAWSSAEAETITSAELIRAIRAVRFAAYREAATLKAKEEKHG